jgi:hypothetical protein
MIVRFLEVGRERKSWASELTSLADRALIKEIKTHRALMSQGIDFAWSDDGTQATIFVGLWRRVGRLEVVGGRRVTVLTESP